jgi:maltose/moltooligosaccharide transporter
MGAYLGLFNGTICVPQIIAAIMGGTILSLVGHTQSSMMLVAGISLFIGAVCVTIIKNKH